MRSSLLIAWGCLLLVPVRAAAQNSVFSVAGIGFPGRFLSTRGRALGGGVGLFDKTSSLNPAAAGGFSRLIAGVATQATTRSYDINGTRVEGLRDTRFPDAVVGGPVGRTGFRFAVGFSLFAERTFDLATSDTIVIRGETVGVDDRVISDGGITDIRASLARPIGSKMWIGVSSHLVTGSTRSTATRSFSSLNFVSFEQTRNIEYSAAGVSVGLMAALSQFLQIAGSVRWNSNLNLDVESVSVASIDLPVALGIGVLVRPQIALRWYTSFVWRSWSGASSSIRELGLGEAFNSWDIGSGVEIGGAGPGTSVIPLRFGVRYARLPFSVSDDQPTELNFSAGTGIQFASNRAALALSVERALRDGAGASEKAWIWSFGIEVRP